MPRLEATLCTSFLLCWSAAYAGRALPATALVGVRTFLSGQKRYAFGPGDRLVDSLLHAQEDTPNKIWVPAIVRDATAPICDDFGVHMATIFQFPYRTVAEVSLPALLRNLHTLRNACRQEVIPVVKADGYGHGMLAISKVLAKRGGCKMLAVATLEEGMELRKHLSHGISILVLSGFFPHQVDAYVRYRLVPMIHQLNHLKSLVGRRELPEIHLKIDSGMRRLGLLIDELPEAMRVLEKIGEKLSGLATHFADSESAVSSFIDKQLTVFESALQEFRARKLIQTDARIHTSNSGAILRHKIGSSNAVRSGLALYGISPNPRLAFSDELLPILQWKSRVLCVKDLAKGDSVGYGRTYFAKRSGRLALIPVGYADGYPRLISNRGYVLIQGRHAPVRGIVSMDLLAVDCTRVANAKEGMLVNLIGGNTKEKLSAWDLAHWAQTIPYEILCGISSRVPRIYLD